MKALVLVSFLVFFSEIFAQNNGFIIKNNKRAEKIKFENFNNLMVIPLQVNGVDMNFLLDTGIDRTILFSFEKVDSLMLKNTKKIKVRGLSSKDKYRAYKSTGNQIKIDKVINKHADIYVIFDQKNYLSGSLGTVINGVIGYDLLKDFIVRFDYTYNTVKFYTPSKFNRALIFFKEKDIQLINKKPHIMASYSDADMGKQQGSFLLDTGSSDAIWLYHNDSLTLPSKKFKDNIGFGLKGIVTGYRSKLDQFDLADYHFTAVNVAFPDLKEDFSKTRVGSIGNEILRRFRFFINYSDQKIYLKTNSFIDDPFVYDKSGLLLRYDGLSIIKKQIPVKISIQKSSVDDASVHQKNKFKTIYEIKKKVKIAGVRENSPAQEAGFLLGDIIVGLENKSINQYDLKEVRNLLSDQDEKKISIKVNRDGKIIEAELELNDRLN